ncbi:MerR family transcriptional regulator [Companilactobacillus halodurans]|uniref:MerR family transcriptional regulator n=1 Tax=Companilactobacillus halodurans TaxID=2584183 RepID=A0A5P0ZWU3_9LACO|nr:MerR family transcriptional regulator [Companilactobacillus halodurans]MQS97566.1 MerR family transcriptional regulator [Companilactobacillus halodurans]
MSEYTTGELAKIAEVSVRTLQYYDRKELLKPSQVLDNGKRIYDDNDLQRLKMILLLKALGISLKAIAEILESPNSVTILNLLLEQRQKELKATIKDSKSKLKTVEDLQRNLPQISQIQIETIDDIEKIMDNKKKLRKVHLMMILYGIPLDILEWGSLFWGVFKGVWWPFIVAIVIAIIVASALTYFYYKNTAYICPNCNSQIKPSFKEIIFAKHNLKTRKLTCLVCGKKDYCVEVYDDRNFSKQA